MNQKFLEATSRETKFLCVVHQVLFEKLYSSNAMYLNSDNNNFGKNIIFLPQIRDIAFIIKRILKIIILILILIMMV